MSQNWTRKGQEVSKIISNVICLYLRHCMYSISELISPFRVLLYKNLSITFTLRGALIMFLSVLKDTLLDHGPGPFRVLARTWNWYSVLSSKSVKIAFLSVVVRVSFSSGTRLFHKWMSYMVIWKRRQDECKIEFIYPFVENSMCQQSIVNLWVLELQGNYQICLKTYIKFSFIQKWWWWTWKHW